MKTRRGKKLGRDEWVQRAQALVHRLSAAAQPVSTPSLGKTPAQNTPAEKTRRKDARQLHEVAHDEWMKWAQVVVDRLAAVVPDFVPLPMPAGFSGEGLAEKPGRGEWIKWANVSVDRLTSAVRIYSKPPYDDVFMADKERQDRNRVTLDLLRRIHVLTDDADTPTDSLSDLEHHDERVIEGLKGLLTETLQLLPQISKDMQLLLKSGWFENCNGRLASELFIGPFGHEPEGIGSGYSVHGRLPHSLHDLLEREESGQGRHPREELRGPSAKNPRWQGEAHRRWGRGNAQSLRSAGRVE